MTNYQYETSPRKLDPDYNRSNKKNKTKTKRKKLKVVKELPRQEVKISKSKKKSQMKLIAASIIALALLLAISYQNSQINVKFSEIQSQKKELAALQKENEQTEVNIENNLNLSNIEQEAKIRLGMEKLTNKQTVYVTLPKKDYIESASEKVNINEEEDKNWFEKLIDTILNRN